MVRFVEIRRNLDPVVLIGQVVKILQEVLQKGSILERRRIVLFHRLLSDEEHRQTGRRGCGPIRKNVRKFQHKRFNVRGWLGMATDVDELEFFVV
jgi:hypothetical protein